jgi:hypothetical protein
VVSTPIVCGGIYRRAGPREGTKHFGTCIAVELQEDGTRVGEIRFFGRVPERFTEGDLATDKLELVGRPASPRVGRPRKEK